MWILIDNYDSFSHILHHYLLMTGNECRVVKNDELSVADVAALNPSRIIISPGPETPLQAGITMDVIARFHQQIPILGVCLGHQAIGMYFGAKLVQLAYPVHGKTSEVLHEEDALFTGIPSPFQAMRYHSLALELMENTPLKVLAYTENPYCIMAIRHSLFPLTGIQFHPESIGTPHGLKLLQNWAEQP